MCDTAQSITGASCSAFQSQHKVSLTVWVLWKGDDLFKTQGAIVQGLLRDWLVLLHPCLTAKSKVSVGLMGFCYRCLLISSPLESCKSTPINTSCTISKAVCVCLGWPQCICGDPQKSKQPGWTVLLRLSHHVVSPAPPDAGMLGMHWPVQRGSAQHSSGSQRDHLPSKVIWIRVPCYTPACKKDYYYSSSLTSGRIA